MLFYEPHLRDKTVLPHDPTSPTARVTVKIMRNNTEVYRMSWLAVAPKSLAPKAP